ncbi:PEBP-like protein [Sistotremastrum suecicum HHB10207 ss-3]|uniref:PEBP-like protein n=1 Tax=Sistotremastrum suecicum HHB10207 ss-3 TaxID=1314776 RepID=A0A165ZWI1_9AGAM|nr:PEBP-like protein [Sistotremastrum suecicum HHB10207 ss-3]
MLQASLYLYALICTIFVHPALGFPVFGTPAQAKAALIRVKLIPDVFPKFDPRLTLGITYHVNGTALKGNLGTNLTPADTANRPVWSIPDIDFKREFERKTFVVGMVGKWPRCFAPIRIYSLTLHTNYLDPDAPSPTNRSASQVRHFIGGGFKLEGTVLRNTTPALSDYLGPGPLPGSPPHRYATFLFLQPKDFPTTPFTTSILNFNLSSFAEQVKMGLPVAGNFIMVGPAPS